MYASETEFQRWVTRVGLEDLLQVRKYINGDGVLLDVVVRSFIDRCISQVGEGTLLDYIDRRLVVERGDLANALLEEKVYELTKGVNVQFSIDNNDYSGLSFLNFESMGYCYKYVEIIGKCDFEDRLVDLNHVYLRGSSDYYKALLGCLLRSYLMVMDRELLLEVLGKVLLDSFYDYKTKNPDNAVVFNIENSYKLFKPMHYAVSGNFINYLVDNVDLLEALDKAGK